MFYWLATKVRSFTLTLLGIKPINNLKKVAPSVQEQDLHDPEFVAQVFDRCAQNYRAWASVASFGFVDRWRKSCVKALPNTSASQPVVFDLMAGTGEVWPHLLENNPNIQKIIAIDISKEMHKQAVQKLHITRQKLISHQKADVLAEPLELATADSVISTFGIKTLNKDQQRLLAKQLAGILKPGGSFSLIEASDPKGWILRPLYRFYLDKVLPLIEKIFLNGAQDFSMLGIYTRSFESCEFMALCLRQEGLEVEYKKYFFGCATGLSGTKPHR